MRRLLLLVSRIWSPCWDCRHPLIPLYSPCFQLPRLASSPWRWLQRWLSWSSQKGDTIVPGTVSTSSSKEARTGRSTSDLLFMRGIAFILFSNRVRRKFSKCTQQSSIDTPFSSPRSVFPSSSASIVERKRGNPSILLSVKFNFLSIRLSLLLALFFLLHPHPSLNAREEILPYYCLVKFNFFLGSFLDSKHPHKIVVVKHGRTRHRDTKRGRKQPRYVSVGFGTYVFSTRVVFSVRRWGFVAPAIEENRCKFMPRVFLLFPDRRFRIPAGSSSPNAF